MKSIENLMEKGILEQETSKHFLTSKRSTNAAKKLIFTTPFLRFWFAFVSPIYKGIKEGKYAEFNTKFENRENDFSDFIFEELALEYLDTIFKDDPLDKLGKYWDDNTQVDLVARTKSGKIIAGNCKYVNSKIKKNKLTKLMSSCENIGLEANIFILFAKNSYTSELKALKSENVKLYNVKSLKGLLKD
jgi:AAA+ ATPase superfamily predicted ATPase